jgi:recombination protein RecA
MKEADRRRAILEQLARTPAAPPEALITGFPGLDAAIGGLPRGRIVEIFGAPGTGKTTLALQIVAHVQRAGGNAAWVDAERAFDPAYAARLGVALERMPVVQPESAEEALEIVRRLALSGAVDVLAIDSAAALVPQAELAAGVGAAGGGLHARVLASGLRRLDAALRRGGAVAIFLNQARARWEDVGEEAGTAAGGPPLKLFAAVRIALRGAGPGAPVRFRVLKSQAGGAFQEGDLPWNDDAGFSATP